MNIEIAQHKDLKRILELQKLCYHENAERYKDFSIPPLKQTFQEIEEDLETKLILKVSDNSKIIGSARAFENNGTCFIGRVIVHPNYQNKGLGKKLMQAIEKEHSLVNRYELFTGFRDTKNIYFYTQLGYKIYKEETINANVTIIYLEKFKTN